MKNVFWIYIYGHMWKTFFLRDLTARLSNFSFGHPVNVFFASIELKIDQNLSFFSKCCAFKQGLFRLKRPANPPIASILIRNIAIIKIVPSANKKLTITVA